MSNESHFPTTFQHFIYLSRYSRWLEDKGRRETWPETVARYFDFFQKHLKERCNYDVPPELRAELETAVLSLEVMPSMRCLMTAGKALELDNTAGYNCSYVAVDKLRTFDEILYILMCGTGVGFSVEDRYVQKLPTIAEAFSPSESVIVVQDSKTGWAKAYRELISLLVGGQIPKWDISKVRPAGARLKTFGGRASGPGPLVDLFRFTCDTFRNAAGRKLTSLECHDLVCKIAEIVVVGGVRRSALISLSDLRDDALRKAKIGSWWESNGQRALANNSAVYSSRPDIGVFMEEWLSLYQSKSGERGIFNRDAVTRKIEMLGGRRDASYVFGVNPCGEILLRSREFCNLTEAVIRESDTVADIARKVKLATILGTWQASLTHFPYLSSEWKKNCQEEALLGVSLTGICDNTIMIGKSPTTDPLELVLTSLKTLAISTNIEHAEKLGINPAAAITTVKPSGTVGSLVDSSSGIHARHAKYFIRTVRADRKDPLCQMMIDAGFPHEPCVMRPEHTVVFEFPMKSPASSMSRNDMSAIDQLELWLEYRTYWTEHNPSVTITVREHEWLEVGAWVYKHFDHLSGVSFLPHSDHSYRQAPYQECDRQAYETLLKSMPKEVDWTALCLYEREDSTTSSKTFACTGDKCEILDLTNS